MATGGSYMSLPISNSVAVQMCMTPDVQHRVENNTFYSSGHDTYSKSQYASQYGCLGRSRPRSAPARRNQYKPSYSRDAFYNSPPKRRTEFTNTEYRTIYFPAQPSSRQSSAKAPFQDRTVQSYKNVSLGHPEVDIGGGVPSIGLPTYEALEDPHLQEYFMRRFTNIPRGISSAKMRYLSKPKLSPRMKANPALHKKTTLVKDAIYKISITTGDHKNHGTSARVYLTIKGSRGKMNKKCLSKCKIATKSKAESKKVKSKPFKFLPGTTQSFKIKHSDVGDIKSITLEHDGLTEKDGWFVEEVEIINMTTKRTWLFKCHQWFSLHHTDCQIARTLYAQLSAKTEYEITVITGDKMGAGTDANVFITVYGKSGQTAKMPLLNRNRKGFERNSSNVFNVKASCVGPLTKVRVEHDNTGTGPGWYLDRIVVTDLTHPKWKYFFPCGQWLAKDEGDGAICRDLVGSKDPLAMKKPNRYKVTVFTGDKRGAGTDANVYCTLFGKDGDSAERRLDNSKNNFERGAKDEFLLEIPCLGTLSRLRIGHDNKGGSAGWFLDKIIVDDLDQNRVYQFPCNRWLAIDEDDGQISRDLYCGGGDRDAAPGVPYVIEVETGDVKQAATSARVYVILYGGKGGTQTSGKIWLTGGKFERGRTDVFNIEVAKMLSPLSKIDVGHDNSGAGPGWHCKQVIVKCPSAGIQQYFPCEKWLALDEEDGLIERTLYEQTSMRKTMSKKVTWYVWIHTSNIQGAGTDANVHLVVYGSNGKSDDVSLDNESNNFEAGQIDNFKVEIDDVGKPYKIRIGHDNSNPAAGWHLDKVEMENMLTKERFIYNCNRWLAKDEDDGATTREIPAEGPGIKTPLPLVKYIAEVHTGSKRGAGTDANVFLNVFGLLGDTGDRPLEKSSTNMNKFEKGNVDIFTFEAVTLKKLSKIRIGHDGKYAGAGWFLDKVVVKQEGTDKYTKTFVCNRWLATDEDDGLIVREITSDGSVLLSTTTYNVTIKTGDVSGAGTDANCYIKIFGESGDTGQLQLRSSETTKNKFERGRLDKFPMQATDIGKIKRLKIGHDGTGIGAGWFIDDVVIDVPSRGEVYRFAMHRWLAVDEEDGKTEIELEPTDVTESDKCIPYEVTIWTSDVRGAGTDANVFLQMYGEDGKTEEYPLRNRTDNFEQAQVDKFKIEAKDIGPLQKIRVGHDGKGAFAGWHLEKILIQRHPTKKSKRMKKNQKKRKASRSPEPDRKSLSKRRDSSLRRANSVQLSDDDLDIDDADSLSSETYSRRLLEFDSEDDVITSDSRSRSATPRGDRKKDKLKRTGSTRSIRSGKDSNTGTKKDKDKKSYLRKFDNDDDDDNKASRAKSSEAGDLEIETESYWFICKRWLARGEDDGKIVRELIATDEDGKPLDHGLQEIEYVVNVKTGDIMGAGTDANVFVTITGENGDTGQRQLQDSNNLNKFERNLIDIFKLHAIDLGKLKKLKIWHDNKGAGGAWFLDYVEVEDTKTKTQYFFPCQQWLARDEEDGQISRTLVPVDISLKSKLSNSDPTAVRKEVALERKAALETYHVHVTTGTVRGSGTDANVYIILFGENDDTGVVPLKATVTGTRDKFEKGQTDEFAIETAEIGELKKIKIGHDDSGIGSAWYLDNVVVDCPSLGRKWLFPCKRWLSKSKDDGALERELYPQDLDTVEYMPCIKYEIKVTTSDRSQADTNADVYMQLYGKEIASQKKSLCSRKSERRKNFKRGATDTFIVELEDVGDTIEKIRIGHDGSGFGDGWHLANVSVRKLHDSGKGSITFHFPCDRWLARDEEDGALERELVAQNITEELLGKDGKVKKKEKKMKEKLLSKKYTVNVYTGDVSGAGTDANVFMTIFGDKGDSGERKLHKSDTYKDKFERGHCDVFQLEIVDLGKIYKCKIRHDNSLINPSWFLDKIEVVDNLQRDTYVFHCERWLAKNKDDGKIDRSLYAKGYDGEMSSAGTLKSFSTRFGGSTVSVDSSDPYASGAKLTKRQSMILEGSTIDGPTISYTVKIRTGDGDDNGTESHAWVVISGGKKKKTTKLYLDMIGKSKFEPGSVEMFSLEAADVGEVKQIEIGHDGVEPGSGWFVKELELNVPTKGKHYHFSCKQWLARDKSDGKTSRVLYVSDGQSSITSYRPMVPYEATFYTGDVSKAGTDSSIKLTVFGDNGSSSEQIIEKKGDRFERARADLVKLELEDISPLKKIRIEHDGKSSRPDWFLEKVELRNMDTGDLYTFNANFWLSKTMGDGKLSKDIAASVRGKIQLRTTSYQVKVKTSDERGAGTNANVYVRIFGELGDSGDLHLKKSEKNSSPFETSQEDVFTFNEMLSLGELTKCRVWHDDKGFGSAWHCAWIEVTDIKKSKKFMFPCNKWLSKSDDDKQILRELTCSTAPDKPKKGDKLSYEITIVTSDKKDGGMIHNAWLIIEGDKKKTKDFVMKNSPVHKIFRKGNTDTFTLQDRYLGKLKRIILGATQREDKPLGSAEGGAAKWHCYEVTVKEGQTGTKYTFPCKKWIRVVEEKDISDAVVLTLDDEKTEEGKVTAVRNLAPVKYEVTVITGDVKGAGTNANVSINLYGTTGDTGKRELKQKFRDLFERKQTDKFEVEALDLGDLTKCHIEHDNSGWRPGWFLERIEVVNLASNKKYIFPCSQWLDEKKGDGKLYKELLPLD